ncbi:Uncharacterised protein [uncultured Clostridium sp.]|uniref:hypothetical protein n=1 Tax=uncultured Clostridium sp. TaxID=59620 RepID=UPI0008230687|nr:hypothetical protein [uncultured Clostridium sp.]SCI99116.1 Uncharacterised protein [uncultured Clostridium sp.]
MSERLIIPVEFSKKREEEIRAFISLKAFSNPSAIIKDILLGRLDINILGLKENDENER